MFYLSEMIINITSLIEQKKFTKLLGQCWVIYKITFWLGITWLPSTSHSKKNEKANLRNEEYTETLTYMEINCSEFSQRRDSGQRRLSLTLTWKIIKVSSGNVKKLAFPFLAYTCAGISLGWVTFKELSIIF